MSLPEFYSAKFIGYDPIMYLAPEMAYYWDANFDLKFLAWVKSEELTKQLVEYIKENPDKRVNRYCESDYPNFIAARDEFIKGLGSIVHGMHLEECDFIFLRVSTGFCVPPAPPSLAIFKNGYRECFDITKEEMTIVQRFQEEFPDKSILDQGCTFVSPPKFQEYLKTYPNLGVFPGALFGRVSPNFI